MKKVEFIGADNTITVICDEIEMKGGFAIMKNAWMEGVKDTKKEEFHLNLKRIDMMNINEYAVQVEDKKDKKKDE